MFKNILLCLILLLSFVPTVQAEKLDVAKAELELKKIGRELSKQREIKQIQASMLKLEALRDKATECENTNSAQLADIDTQIAQSKITDPDQEDKKLHTFLQSKRSKILDQNSACKILLIKVNETIRIYSDILENLETTSRLAVISPIWKSFYDTIDYIKTKKLEVVDQDKFIDNFALNYGLMHLAMLVLSLLLALLLARIFRKLVNHDEHIEETTSFLKTSLIMSKNIFKKNIMSIIFIVTFTLYSGTIYMMTNLGLKLLFFAGAILTWKIYQLCIEFLFFSRREDLGLGLVPLSVAPILARRLKLLGVVTLLALLLFILSIDQALPETVLLFGRTIFMTIVTLGIFNILWQILRVQALFKQSRFIRIMVVLLLAMSMMTLLTMEWLGYHALTFYIITRAIISLGLGFVAWILHFLVTFSLDAISSSQSKWNNMLYSALGVKRNTTLSELIWVRIACLALVWGALILALLKIWVVSDYDYQFLLNALLYGFTISNITIAPSQMIAAIFVFVTLSLLTRGIRKRVAIRTPSQRVPGMQHSIAAIVGYIGFSLAFIISLLVAGINFTGIAFIAGALSVGIGFGLQNIVNNFVSGLILLIERPIKPGDRVLVGQHEGFVKSISIRSTVISSLDKMDVILPNSELISGEVTNLMLDDKYYRLRIFIGVGYTSDLDLVFETLNKVAYEHPDVIKEEPLQPKILFNAHGDSALEFEMRVILRDVNRRQLARSELNTNINRAFRENHIEIPFPQRDINFRDSLEIKRLT